MKTIVNLFHPDYQDSRVNRALVNAVSDEFEVRNIYELYPDFKIDVEKEKQAMLAADRIVIEFPMHWYSAPALLQQWEDVMITPDWAFGPEGQLQGKDLLLAVTLGANNYGRDQFVKYTPNELLRPFQAVSRVMGTNYLKPFEIVGARTISDEDLAKAAKDYRAYLEQEEIPVLGDFE
jgi:putative NADPH-quinone reductase